MCTYKLSCAVARRGPVAGADEHPFSTNTSQPHESVEFAMAIHSEQLSGFGTPTQAYLTTLTAGAWASTLFP